jgi:hypothetical protein
MFFNMPVVFPELEADLLKMRARKGMAIAPQRQVQGLLAQTESTAADRALAQHGSGSYTIRS